jgi:flavin reductase (DIM6/NTAB) family NADH-FMN oxidoreductase RutF
MTHAPQADDLSPRRLRDAFGCFATGVTVVTTLDDEGGPLGLTANSFTSVSLDPPLLLYCVDSKSRRAPKFLAASRFAVNVLHAGQEALSTRFARSAGDGFGDIEWETWAGTPVLRDAMASFVCTGHASHEGGDHAVIIGRVEQLRFDPAPDPLIYFQGRYRSVHVPD